ncbi:MAG: cytochrome c biogenesis protein CcdA [Vicinamibacterales bacterium]|nr:cytochrome c biogenesis protein CcdA [Vicinamibacterales bacterium]
MEENVTLLAAFGAGLLSFLSPCVLPLIPGYLSYISGLSLDQMRGLPAGGGVAVAVGAPPEARRQVILASLAFILGFSLVFVALGASASYIGQFLTSRLTLLGRIAGAIIIIFGLHTMGVLRIEWLYQEKRVQTTKRPAGFVGAVLVGSAFAFGWTPCLGPILAGILAVAATQNTVGHGVRLLAAYSLGLGVPFLATALAINRFFVAFAKIRRHYHAIELASGALLVVIGVLIFTNRFTVIAQWLSPYLPVY